MVAEAHMDALRVRRRTFFAVNDLVLTVEPRIALVLLDMEDWILNGSRQDCKPDVELPVRCPLPTFPRRLCRG